LDLLFGENVILIAKVSEAAVNHSDEYASYATVLAANGDDLANEMRLAFGATAAGDFATLWTAQNASFIDYAIGVVTHNQDMAGAAMTRLVSESAPSIDALFTSLLHMRTGALIERYRNQLTSVKQAIDDQFGQHYKLAYEEIHNSYVMGTGLGDFLAPPIASAFPDKFPGDMSTKSVTDRVVTNNLLQERVYLLTMASDSFVNGRPSEGQQALAQLATNAGMIGRFKDAWALEMADVMAYATKGDDASRQALAQGFTDQLASTAHVPATLVADQASAMVKAIDDQRSKANQSLAGDDRAAATAMQPIADAISSQG